MLLIHSFNRMNKDKNLSRQRLAYFQQKKFILHSNVVYQIPVTVEKQLKNIRGSSVSSIVEITLHILSHLTLTTSWADIINSVSLSSPSSSSSFFLRKDDK